MGNKRETVASEGKDVTSNIWVEMPVKII